VAKPMPRSIGRHETYCEKAATLRQPAVLHGVPAPSIRQPASSKSQHYLHRPVVRSCERCGVSARARGPGRTSTCGSLVADRDDWLQATWIERLAVSWTDRADRVRWPTLRHPERGRSGRFVIARELGHDCGTPKYAGLSARRLGNISRCMEAYRDAVTADERDDS